MRMPKSVFTKNYESQSDYMNESTFYASRPFTK